MMDRRINAFRPDLAERRLDGMVTADRFVDGDLARVTVPVAGLRPRPDWKAGLDTQLLFGELVTVFERKDGFAWVKSALDDYVGYVEESALGDSREAPTHIVSAPRSFAYDEPDMKRPVRFCLSMGSRLNVASSVETRGVRYLVLDNGAAVLASHCRSIDETIERDPVALAALLLETPYLWGGRSAFGLDCSGLVQLTLMMVKTLVPRDSDQQAQSLGTIIDRQQAKRGDLVFWQGHVAWLEDEQTILHANGQTMSVARQSLAETIERIRPFYGEPTVWRRP